MGDDPYQGGELGRAGPDSQMPISGTPLLQPSAPLSFLVGCRLAPWAERQCLDLTQLSLSGMEASLESSAGMRKR